MKKYTFLTFIISVAVLLGFHETGHGQLLLEENFDYPANDLITAHGWTAHSGSGTQAITVNNGGLTFTGYVGSGIGNAALADNNGEDDNHVFTIQTAGVIYTAFMVNITTTAAGYFFHLGGDPIGTSYRGRIFMDATNHFGVSVGSNTGTFSAATYSPGTTYLLVLKYEIVSGTNNDIVSLFVLDSAIPPVEPAIPTIGPLTDAAISDISPGSVAIRQFNSSQNLIIDGIRTGLSWTDVLPAAIVPPTVQAHDITFSGVTSNSMNVNWTNGDGTNRITVINTSNSFTNPVDGTDPTANPAYGGSGEQVVFNGNVATVAVTGLAGNTTYWLRVYEYNGSGSSTSYLTAAATLNPNSQATEAIVTAPVITLPAASAIGNNSAILGGTITNDGGAAITERGTVWNTSPGVTIADNKLAEGGTATGIFSHTRSGLPAQSLIYFKAYASNSIGTSLTGEGSFFTLSDEPTSHVAGFTAVAGGNTSINLAWTSAATGADGYIILQKTGATEPSGIPADATGYSEGSTLGDGTVAALVAPGSTLTRTITGLSPGTQYSFTIFPYSWDGVNNETYNYYTIPVVPTATATTTGTASTVYTWQGADNGSWTTPANWNPARNVATTSDVLQFNEGTTKTITGVPTQTISRFLMANNSTINLQSAGPVALTISGAAGADLEIPEGCALNLNAVNAISIVIVTTATGSISGNMKFSSTSSTAHRLTAADPGAIMFNNGSVFTAGTFFSGNAFGTSSLGSVIFSDGSTYLQQAGSNPFGAGQPNSVVVFQTGSLFKVMANLTPSFSGRTYSNFEMDAPGVTLSPTGGNPVSIDDFTITNGTFNFNMTGPTSGLHQIKGSILVKPAAILNFSPASAGTVTMSGSAPQSITINGTMNANANLTLEISNNAGIDLNSPVTLNGNLKLSNGFLTLGPNDVMLNPTSSITGTPSASAMIVATGTGQLLKGFTAGFTGIFVFPVGDITGTPEYSPVALNFTSGTFGTGNYAGVNLVNEKYPGDPNTSSYLNRYWTVSSSAITGFNCSANFQYNPGDVAGNELQMFSMQVVPAPFTDFGLVDNALHQLNATGLTASGTYTGSQPRPVVLTTAATLIDATTATLNGEVTANFNTTTISFEYGLTTSYGSVVPGIPAIVTGGTANTALADITGLTQNTTYHFRINGDNVQGTSNGNDLTFTTTCPAPSAAGTISGPVNVCKNGTGYVYTVPAIPNAASYTWTLPAGATITAGANTNSITVSFSVSAVSGDITVYGTSVCGTGALSPAFAITVNPQPVPTITGPATVCINSSGNLYTTEAGMTGYLWTVSAGGTITGGSTTDSITVNWTTAGPQTVTVTYTNGAGCTAAAPASFPLTVISLPVPTISGPGVVCANAANIVYTTEPGMTNYNWAVSIGGTIISGAGTNAITVLWPYAGNRTVSVTYTNPTGCVAITPTIFNVTINPAAVPVIGSSNNPCINSVNNQYITNSGMLNYAWNISSGGVIVSGQGTNTINVTWNSVGAQWVNVTFTNTFGCSAVTPTVYNLFVNPLPNAAGTITGTASLCAGATGVAYSCQEILNATSYTWNLPAGATIASGAGTRNITVDFAANAMSGNITVAGTNSCGNGSLSPPFAVAVGPLPAAAGIITGSSSVCSGATGVEYSVPPIANAAGYFWTLPAGATYTIGATPNSIVVTFGPPAGMGVITVAGINSCGSGTVSPAFNVLINAVPEAPVVSAIGAVLTSSSPVGNQWYYEGNAIPGATGQSYTVTNNTGYYWCVVTINGCSSPVSNKVWVVITGTQELQSHDFSIYPVPNDGKFMVSVTNSGQGSYSILMYNYLGSKIFEQTNVQVKGKFEMQIDLRQVPAGIYSVVLSNRQNKVIRKLIITR